LVRAGFWKKIIRYNTNQLWKRISQPSEGVGGSDLDTERIPDDAARKSENLMWIFTILVFSGMHFQSDRSHL